MGKYVDVELYCKELKKLQEKNVARPLGATMNIGLCQAIEVANYMAFEAREENETNEDKT